MTSGPAEQRSHSATSGDKRKRVEDRANVKEEPESAKDEDEDEDEEEDEEDEVKDENLDEKLEDDEEPPAKAPKKDPSTGPLDWLLSEEAFDMANPEIPAGRGEIDLPEGTAGKPPPRDAGKRSSISGDEPILRYPQSRLTPFQNLVAACLLSKPISHRLGLRTIQTLLNPPFGLRTLDDLDEAGYEGRRKVMWEARTQHKEKTAAQLGDVCEGVRELCGDRDSEEELNNMVGIREQLEGLETGDATDKVVQLLTQVKGIGPGVAGIFLRRVQGNWEEVFPFADDRSLAAARRLGLIEDGGDANDLAKLVAGDRTKLVRLLDTLIGLDLEKKLDEAVAKVES